MKRRSRTHSALKLTQLRWTSYAVAAGATAAGTVPTVEAEIHYSGPVEYKFAGTSSFKTQTFPLSNGAHLIGAANRVPFLDYNYAYFGVDNAQVSNSLRGPGSVSGFNQLDALPGRQVVSDGQFFPTPFYRFALLEDGDCINPGWRDRGTYYVGFRFNTGRGPQYGWVRLRWSGCPRNYFIVKDYAWGDPGDQIKTGQKQLKQGAQEAASRAAKNAEATPPAESLGSLGLLALGAVGLPAWRATRASR